MAEHFSLDCYLDSGLHVCDMISPHRLSDCMGIRLPMGVIAFPISFTVVLSKFISPKWIILLGLSLQAIGTVLFALGGGHPDQYWTFIFPGFTIGSGGSMLVFTHTK